MRKFAAHLHSLAVALTRRPRAQQGAVEDVVIAVPNFTFTLTPTFVADEQGLWAKHGLRFKMIQVAGVGSTNAVIAGSADFAQAGGSTLTRANARGQHLIAIANTVERNIVDDHAAQGTGAGFRSQGAAREARAGAARADHGRRRIQANPHAYLRVVAARAGIDPESIRVTAMEGNSSSRRSRPRPSTACRTVRRFRSSRWSTALRSSSPAGPTATRRTLRLRLQRRPHAAGDLREAKRPYASEGRPGLQGAVAYMHESSRGRPWRSCRRNFRTSMQR